MSPPSRITEPQADYIYNMLQYKDINPHAVYPILRRVLARDVTKRRASDWIAHMKYMPRKVPATIAAQSTTYGGPAWVEAPTTPALRRLESPPRGTRAPTCSRIRGR